MFVDQTNRKIRVTSSELIELSCDPLSTGKDTPITIVVLTIVANVSA